MNKRVVVTRLIEEVKYLRFRGSRDEAIRCHLIEQGWAFGAVQEALSGALDRDMR